jgi:hypothetical protein
MAENIPVKFDVMVYSIPKSGTHLVSDILALIYRPNCNIYSKEKMYRVIAHLVGDGNLTEIDTRGISTHPKYIGYSIVNRLSAKKIFTVRHPLDVAISRYYYVEKRLPVEKRRSLWTYVQAELPKIVEMTEKHLSEFKQMKGEKLLLAFERVTRKKRKAIGEIAEFLGIGLTGDAIESIVRKTSFEEVQRQEQRNGLYKVGITQPHLFHRKGQTEQWREEFTKEQYQTLLKRIPGELEKFFAHPKNGPPLPKKPSAPVYRPRRRIGSFRRPDWREVIKPAGRFPRGKYCLCRSRTINKV